MNQENKTLSEAIRTFGVPHQIETMLIEELAELTQAITKAKRAGIIKEWGIIPPSKEASMAQIEAYNHLCSEAMDVEIVLDQLKILLDPEFMKISRERKIKRLQERIDKLKQPKQA